VTSLNQSLTDL